MTSHATTLASGHGARRETRPSALLMRLLLLTSALSALAGAVLATAVLDRLAEASAPPHLAPVPAPASAPTTTGGRDVGVPGSDNVFFGRPATPDDPAGSY